MSAAAVPFAALAAALSATVYLMRLPPLWFGDADWYATSMPALRGDGPLYPPEWLGPHIAARPPQFNLPPATALFGPAAALGRLPWGLLMLAALVAALVILWPRLSGRWGLLLACAVLGFWPVIAAAAWANVNSLVFLLFAVAYRWPRQAGWALGAAAAVKAAPIFALAVLIGRRQWRQLGVALGVGAGLTAVAALLTDLRAPWHFLLVQMHESHPEGEWRWSVSDVLPEPWTIVAALLLGGLAVWRGGSWWLAITACLVAVPTLHHHYLIWILVPVFAQLRGWGGVVSAEADEVEDRLAGVGRAMALHPQPH